MSTPKEKAKELFNKMYNCEPDISYYAAKECALIAVDEILDNFGSRVGDKTHYCNYLTIQYYEEVKKEIELL
jgi:hypothetical protein